MMNWLRQNKGQAFLFFIFLSMLIFAISLVETQKKAATEVKEAYFHPKREVVIRKIEAESRAEIDNKMRLARSEISKIIDSRDIEIERILSLPEDSLQFEIDKHFNNQP